MASYSYTTVCVDPDGTARTSVHLHPDEQVSVLCGSGQKRAQISLSHASADVIITPTNPEAPTARDLAVARKLAESFARYPAEVERLHELNAEPADSVEGTAA
ncbi:hypothetical protein E1287_38990 [Actinomadura sp. KC06]|uniref:hypothetical protein n=1 Tax=Actinomadura sp. KC06 TaxID=2530369 RepID=UPI0010434255|nr:hypothetical protein [Actinomadura sp. KC06]TDD23456.1 hypothetical protein E1287_38990 [Actinomadura sp. KC06]